MSPKILAQDALDRGQRFIWAKCSDVPNAEHNHIACDCPTCENEGQIVWKCVLSGRWYSA